ncbi:MAG: filamentous hemagglutinin N-terminal domain-containing protein [Sterolibacteriaceae bacterium]|nr:filamentous hemagglutinin N-terminal domain-containing protein [Candidatus Methylophosphatis haderslevensis]
MKRNVATRAAAQSSVAPSIDCAANRRTGPWRMRPLALAVAGALGAGGPAWALPTGPQVVSGQLGVVTPAAGRMDLTQGSAKAVVNWRGFGIAGGETVRLQQPIGGQALFRVTGNDPSQILGQLSASGHLFLINPRGVLFGGQSRVDVGSLTATTLNLTDGDFLAGRWRFAGDSRAGVDNQGSINAAPGGSIVLLGSQVGNSGSLNAPQGTVALGAGSAATLDVYGNGLVRLNLTGGADAARIEHTGSIGADGGVASLAARGAGSTPAAINVDGVVRAQSLVDRNGSIYLSAGPQGEVNLRGTLDASAGAGAASGGRIEIGADRITVAAPARLLADAAGRGDGGTINAIATDTMNFAGTLSARGGAAGGDGGNAEVSGHVALTMNGMADLSAPAGRFGTLLLDPGSISIIDSTGNQAGPNVFGDAQVAQLLGAANLTISTANATNNAPETIGVDGAANVTWSAATTLTLNAGRNITVNSGAVISNTAAATGFNAIVMNANRGATPVTGNFSGISIGAATLSTAGGNLVFNGTGGNNGSNAGGSNLGIVLTSAALTTSAGAIRLNGQGGTSAGNIDIGMFIQGSTSIQATGSGSVSVTGTGGGSAGSAANAGIGVPTGASVSLRTASGALSITGTGGPGSSSYGIWQQGALALQSGSGTITLSGSAASTINGLQFDAGSTSITSASGDILLLADRMNFTGVTGATAGTLALRPLTAGRAITIGAADTTTSLGLSATELAGLRPSGRLEIGSATAGPLTVASALAPAAGTGTLALISGGTIDVNAPITGGGARLNLNGTAGVRLGAALSSNAANVASTRAIAIRSSGIFDNQVGAGALSTPAGTWTVSLATPAGQNFNGLLSGNNAVWNNPVSSNVNPTGNRYSFAIAPSIVVDAANASKTYGDVLPAAVALNGAPASSLASSVGGAFNDYATASVSGTYLRASPGLPATAGVGSYALTISDFTNLSSTLPGYAFVLGRPGTLSVTPRPLTLTPSATSRIYGDPNPATSGASGDPGGLVNGDSVTRVDLRTAAGTTSNVGTCLTSGSNAVFGKGPRVQLLHHVCRQPGRTAGRPAPAHSHAECAVETVRRGQPGQRRLHADGRLAGQWRQHRRGHPRQPGQRRLQRRQLRPVGHRRAVHPRPGHQLQREHRHAGQRPERHPAPAHAHPERNLAHLRRGQPGQRRLHADGRLAGQWRQHRRGHPRQPGQRRLQRRQLRPVGHRRAVHPRPGHQLQREHRHAGQRPERHAAPAHTHPERNLAHLRRPEPGNQRCQR